MVRLPHGRMKSREGTVVDVDHLLDDVRSMCVEQRQQVEQRAEVLWRFLLWW